MICNLRTKDYNSEYSKSGGNQTRSRNRSLLVSVRSCITEAASGLKWKWLTMGEFRTRRQDASALVEANRPFTHNTRLYYHTRLLKEGLSRDTYIDHFYVHTVRSTVRTTLDSKFAVQLLKRGLSHEFIGRYIIVTVYKKYTFIRAWESCFL